MEDDKKTWLKHDKPQYSMDVMRLVALNELSIRADNYRIGLEAGNDEMIMPFRATLKVIFIRIKRFCTEKYPKQFKKLKIAFDKVDETFDFVDIKKNDEQKFQKAKKGLFNIHELMSELIDEIWVKAKRTLPEEEKAVLYAFGRA